TKDGWDLSVFRYAGRAAAPAPDLTALAAAKQRTAAQAAPAPAAPAAPVAATSTPPAVTITWQLPAGVSLTNVAQPVVVEPQPPVPAPAAAQPAAGEPPADPTPAADPTPPAPVAQTSPVDDDTTAPAAPAQEPEPEQ